MSEKVVVCLTTVSSEEEAERIARALLERRLAACVNVIPRARSFYRWKGEIQSDAELLLVIKTVESRTEELGCAVRELHSYDLPELVRLEVSGGDAEYLAWVALESVELRDDPASD